MCFHRNVKHYTGLHLFEQLWLTNNQNKQNHHTKCTYDIIYFDPLKAIIIQTNTKMCKLVPKIKDQKCTNCKREGATHCIAPND